MKGRCVICGTPGKLTRDHVPPRGAVVATPLEVRRLAEYLTAQPADPASRRAFQSIERPTLCQECNTQRLGKEYDPSLIELCRDAGSWISARYTEGLVLPGSFSLATKPQRVARAIIGHLLAAEERPDPAAPLISAPMPDAMRAYFLNPSMACPPTLRVFCWPYPSSAQVIIRGAGWATRPGLKFVVGDFLKFFPLAFWVVFDPPADVPIELRQLPLADAGVDQERSIEVRLTRVPRVDWPEHPGSDGILMLDDQQTSHAIPENKR